MLVVLYFLVIFYFFWRVRKENTIRRLIFGVYSFSAFCSVLYYIFIPLRYEQNVLAYIYYIICTIILLFPIWNLGGISCKDFTFPRKFIQWLSYILIIFGIISLANIIPNLFTIQTYLNNLSELRSAYYHGDDIFESNSSLLFIMANWVRYIQFFSPCLAFINYIKGNKLISVLLTIVSLVPALSNLLIGEREACIVVLSNFIFAYIFFKPILSRKIAEKIKKIGILISLPLVAFVIAMTMSRFGDSDGGVGRSILVYVGEQPFNFSYIFSYINIDQQNLGGRLSFGYLFPEEEQLVEQINYYINAGEYLNTFSGIPGFMLLDFSYGAILVIGLISFFFTMVFSHKRNLKTGKYNFSIFMAYLIYYQIIFMGVFYFDFKSKYVVYMCILLFVGNFITQRIPNFNKSII